MDNWIIREKMKKKNNYTFWENMKYVVGKQWDTNKSGVLFPILNIPMAILNSMLLIYFPKIVLELLMNEDKLQNIIIVIIIVTLLLTVLSYATFWLSKKTEFATIKLRIDYLSRDFLKKIFELDYDVLTSPSGKNKIQRAENALSKTSSAWHVMTNLLKNILGFLSYSLVIVTLNPIIILLLVLSYVIDAVCVKRVEGWIHSTKEERAEIERKFRYIAFGIRGLSFAKDIRIYDMKKWLMDVSNTLWRDKYQVEWKIARKRLLLLFFEGILLFFRDGFAYIYLIYRILFDSNAAINVADFTVYFATISGFGSWLSNIINSYSDLKETNYYIWDFRTFLEMKSKNIVDGTQKVIMPSKCDDFVIELRNVCFYYEGSDADEAILENINLKIRKGEKLAIVGLNGSGKTTLIKLLCGLLQPTSGEILFNNINVAKFEKTEYYKFFTAVFQNASIIPTSIAENITFVDYEEIDRCKLSRCIELAGLTDKIILLDKGIETNLVSNVAENAVDFSGGEVQKLLLARALYNNGSIIILDEPTAALDPIAERRMYMKYNELVGNKTSIFISHRLSATRFCDRIIVLGKKRILESGTHEELMTLGKEYANLFNIQSRYYQENYEEEME